MFRQWLEQDSLENEWKPIAASIQTKKKLSAVPARARPFKYKSNEVSMVPTDESQKSFTVQ